MDILSKIKKDIKLGGIFFISFYVISTAIIPNIIFNKKLLKMDKISIFFWLLLIILWQLYILYSFYTYFYISFLFLDLSGLLFAELCLLFD